MHELADEQTLLACLTPPGAAAIATLALRGPHAWWLVRALFQPLKKNAGDVPVEKREGEKREGEAPAEPSATEKTGSAAASPSRILPAEPEPGRVWLGRLGENAQLADQIVLTVKRVEPAPWLELHCHGGREVVRLLEETLVARGARLCSWLELEMQTTQQPQRVTALRALSEAPTTRTASILLDQYHGAFARAVAAVIASLEKADWTSAAREIEELSRFTSVGRHLTTPWRIVVAGAPNVGKSSLVNALAGYQRSVVDAQPGTTRDVVTTRLAIDGWPVEVADTAGWHAASQPLEQEGIALARQAAMTADLRLWVLDGSTSPVWSDLRGVRSVINKIDQPPAWDFAEAQDAVCVSARSGAGLATLCDMLSDWLVPHAPPPGAAVPFTAKLCDQTDAVSQLLAAHRITEAKEILRTLWTEPSERG